MAKKTYKTLHLILGDQLNLNHSWYDSVDDTVMYFIAEMRQETDYVRHHIQKVVAFFDSMRNMAEALKVNGLYWTFLDDKKDYFQRNNRMSMMMSLLEKMDNEKLVALKIRASDIISNPDAY